MTQNSNYQRIKDALIIILENEVHHNKLDETFHTICS